MAILRIRDENGQVHGIRALKGEAGAGVHVGSYEGNGELSARYISLRTPHVRAVLLMAEDPTVFPLAIVTKGGVKEGGTSVAYLVDAYTDGDIDIAVKGNANLEGVTYHYIAFVEEGAV